MAIDIANPGASGPALTAALQDLLPLNEVILGRALGVDYNTVADTPITIAATKYAVSCMISINNVGGNDNGSNSLRTAMGGGGTELIHNSTGTKANNLCIGSRLDQLTGDILVRTESTLYFRVTFVEGSPATGDVYVMGYDLSNL